MSRAKQRLRANGIEANEVSASRFMHVPHTSLWVAPKGHALFDPRSLDPVDEAMAQDMADRVARGECPNTDALLVWEQGERLIVGDGHGRSRALVRAAEILDRVLMPLVEFFVGDEKAFLLARARRNDHGRFARVDAPSILAFRVKQLVAVGADAREIADACPRNIGPAEVDALARWESLVRELRPRFDSGEIPIGLLAAILEVARGEQVARAEKFLTAGVRTGQGAKRATNKERATSDPWARRMTPRQVTRAADALDALDRKGDAGRMISLAACCLRLSKTSGTDAAEILDNMPKLIADTIRDASKVGAQVLAHTGRRR